MVGRGTGSPGTQVRWRLGSPRLSEDLRSLVSSAPAFVAAMVLSPAEWGDEDGDDEIFFFFTETSRVLDSYERIKVPRVARVCAVRALSWLAVISQCFGLPSLPPWASFASLLCLVCSPPRLLSWELEEGEGEGSGHSGDSSSPPHLPSQHTVYRKLGYIRSLRKDVMMDPGSSPAPPLPASVTSLLFLGTFEAYM
jgi:hypothetical protein